MKQSRPQKKERLFRFKQFSILHERSGMKVGTDGVLLGAWVNTGGAVNILDIGTGTGVIALMLAQRSVATALIDAIEIDPIAAEEAWENVLRSPWPAKVKVHCMAVQKVEPVQRYDLIVSNPPYFNDSYKPPHQQRETARHTDTLRVNELLQVAQQLLLPSGKLNVILPVTEGEKFELLAPSFGFHMSRRWTFRTRKHKPAERLLFEFSRTPTIPEQGEILLYGEGEKWSEEYHLLTRDFYLNS